nr:response regulator [Bacteroides sp. 214]
MICLFSDITESQKKKEQLIEAKEKAEISDRLKSAFLANMSHEIRTPLNAIIGFSELLVEAEEKEEKEEYFNIVQKNSDLLLQLISDILDISKIEAGTLEIVNTVVDVNKLFNEVLHYYQLKTENSPVKVIFEQQMSSCYIYSDENRLTQILNNFINNALKFTTEGQISIGYYQVDRKTVKFYVKDTGSGIAKQDLDSVFHRFVKLNHFVAGTGLGLSICQSLVTQMHGEIGVESELGVGSTFWFTHPYDPNQEMPTNGKNKNIQSKPEKKESSTTTKRKPVILVAEDTDSNFFLLTSIIRDKYKLIRAYNGLEAIEMYKTEKPDLILMDVSMPEMDGLTATREIRKTDWEIPIIAVTAFAFDSDKKKAIDAGCNDYMSKPIKAGYLLEKIAEYTS